MKDLLHFKDNALLDSILRLHIYGVWEVYAENDPAIFIIDKVLEMQVNAFMCMFF